jgi:DNA-binding MarR family transcriptional regulator
MSRSKEARRERADQAGAADPDRPATVRCARQLLGLRRLREEMLGGNLFADPAWDLLLHLYVESAAGNQVAISGLCSAAKVRPTTGLRWINLLVDAGLLEKSDDPEDARRVFVGFAPGADESIHRILARAMTESTAEPPAEVA